MIDFKNKTIAEVRDEIMLLKGKETSMQCGKNVFIGEVSRLQRAWYVTYRWSSGFEFEDDLTQDEINKYEKLFKGEYLTRHYGFKVEKYQKQGENTVSQTELITVPYNGRNKKMFVSHSGETMIISELK